MARDEPSRHALPQALERPAVSLIGSVDATMVEKLGAALASAHDDGSDVVIEVTTNGGDAELGRRMALDVQRDAARRRGRLLFLGKTEVYSAGVTAMAGFCRECRYVTRDTMLFIHCRQLSKTLTLDGPLRGNLPKLDQIRHEIETGLALEQQGFAQLIEGSDVTLDEINERALAGWYLDAEEAVRRGLVAKVV